MSTKLIKTQRLMLRPCTLDDLYNLYPLWTDKSVQQYQDIIELNLSILLEKRRKGYATEATKSILRYAKNLDLTNRIISLIDEPNIASIKVMENSGMIVYKNQIVSDQKVLFYKVKSLI